MDAPSLLNRCGVEAVRVVLHGHIAILAWHLHRHVDGRAGVVFWLCRACSVVAAVVRRIHLRLLLGGFALTVHARLKAARELIHRAADVARGVLDHAIHVFTREIRVVLVKRHTIAQQQNQNRAENQQMRADERRDEGEQQRNVENRNRLPRNLHTGA